MYFSKAEKKEAEKRYIRLDKHLERLKLSGYIVKARRRFKLPKNGYTNTRYYRRWLDKIIDADKYDKWAEYIIEGLHLAKLPTEYFSNVECLIGLNFSGAYVLGQDGILHKRTDKNYFRSKKITELYSQVDSKTGKKAKSEDVARVYQITDEELDKMPQKKAYKFIDKFNLGGPEVRKISSKFKKQILK